MLTGEEMSPAPALVAAGPQKQQKRALVLYGPSAHVQKDKWSVCKMSNQGLRVKKDQNNTGRVTV